MRPSGQASLIYERLIPKIYIDLGLAFSRRFGCHDDNTVTTPSHHRDSGERGILEDVDALDIRLGMSLMFQPEKPSTM